MASLLFAALKMTELNRIRQYSSKQAKSIINLPDNSKKLIKTQMKQQQKQEKNKTNMTNCDNSTKFSFLFSRVLQRKRQKKSEKYIVK